MISQVKREKMEKVVYLVFSALDPSKTNTKKYKEMFQSMNDKQFTEFIEMLFDDPDLYLILDTVDYEHDLLIENIEKAADILKIPLFETLFEPHITMDKNNVVATKEPVPVGYAHIKRPQQTVSKKNGLSTNVDSRSAITGQVTGHDKNGRDSDVENTMMISMGLDAALRELNGPRADDPVMRTQMYNAIYRKGFVSLSELESDPVNKTALNTADVFFLGMSLKTDLVTKGLMVKKTLKEEA